VVTRATAPITDRQVLRRWVATVVTYMRATSQAACSSNARVNRAPGRAHGVSATTTPCSGQRTRGAWAWKYTQTGPRSRPRQRADRSRCRSRDSAARSADSGSGDA